MSAVLPVLYGASAEAGAPIAIGDITLLASDVFVRGVASGGVLNFPVRVPSGYTNVVVTIDILWANYSGMEVTAVALDSDAMTAVGAQQAFYYGNNARLRSWSLAATAGDVLLAVTTAGGVGDLIARVAVWANVDSVTGWATGDLDTDFAAPYEVSATVTHAAGRVVVGVLGVAANDFSNPFNILQPAYSGDGTLRGHGFHARPGATFVDALSAGAALTFTTEWQGSLAGRAHATYALVPVSGGGPTVLEADGASAASSAVSGTSNATARSTGAVNGISAGSGAAAAVSPSTAAASASSASTGVAATIVAAGVASTGAAAVTGAAARLVLASAAAVASGTAAAVASASASGVGALAGTSAVSGTAAAVASASASSAGDAAVAGQGAALGGGATIVGADGAAASTAAALGSSAALATGIGAGFGGATAAGQASATAAGAGAATGLAAASVNAALVRPSGGAAVGVATAAGPAAAVHTRSVSSAGAAAGAALTAALHLATGSTAGVAMALSVTSNLRLAVGLGAGAASAFWEAVDLAAPVSSPRSTRYLQERLLAQQSLRDLRGFTAEQALVAEALRNT